ncbi:hypothetical protein DHL47_08400 [Streptococcus panodentis]|uniref:Uncharacterized protein n=1 Tax=Streptococcus panodentis TaxID=1581472 RepID=A0ABS5AY29_9STRE|nr:hypothetical protein [Streptococcus panodentis]
MGEGAAIMRVLYGIFQKIAPSVGEDTDIMGVCPTATTKSKGKDCKTSKKRIKGGAQFPTALDSFFQY